MVDSTPPCTGQAGGHTPPGQAPETWQQGVPGFEAQHYSFALVQAAAGQPCLNRGSTIVVRDRATGETHDRSFHVAELVLFDGEDITLISGRADPDGLLLDWSMGLDLLTMAQVARIVTAWEHLLVAFPIRRAGTPVAYTEAEVDQRWATYLRSLPTGQRVSRRGFARHAGLSRPTVDRHWARLNRPMPNMTQSEGGRSHD
jgi:hypothetical protein